MKKIVFSLDVHAVLHSSRQTDQMKGFESHEKNNFGIINVSDFADGMCRSTERCQ